MTSKLKKNNLDPFKKKLQIRIFKWQNSTVTIQHACRSINNYLWRFFCNLEKNIFYISDSISKKLFVFMYSLEFLITPSSTLQLCRQQKTKANRRIIHQIDIPLFLKYFDQISSRSIIYLWLKISFSIKKCAYKKFSPSYIL